MTARRSLVSLFAILLFFLSALAPLHALAMPALQATDEPDIEAHEAIVVEYPSGRILYQKAAHERMAPASLTKILTAILALEYGNPDDVVTAVPDDLKGESTMGLASGEQQTLHNLMYGMLLPSGNDAAMAIARHVGSKVGNANPAEADPVGRFVAMMNYRATQLGLADSHFVNPHGLDTNGHYSSAYDLASLTWYALHIPAFNEIVGQVSYEAPGHPLLNTNEMLTRYPGADGVKTGWTDGCGLCLVTSATRDGHRLIAVVLNAPHWYKDSATILDYGFARLAASPKDAGAEVLGVARRDTVSWMLANPSLSPPLPVLPAAMAQGGGIAPAPAKAASAPAMSAVSAPAQPNRVPAYNLVSGRGGSNMAVVLVIFGVVVSVGCVLAYKLKGIGPLAVLSTGKSALSSTLRRSSARREAPASVGFVAFAPRPMPTPKLTSRPTSSFISMPTPAHTLGTPIVTRRREPNLLLTPEDDIAMHVERGVALAADGKQGSSMSEFLFALRAGGNLDIADLTAIYRLSPAAFMALARAQAAVGHAEDARRTLLHGVLVMPGEHVLRLALYQLRLQQ